ncbi:MAG TPA: transglycosylase family protein [Pseudonocardiaceae bacterium]|nr:transglycosylase family protein [Pseudonocardiaceae bacterium]
MLTIIRRLGRPAARLLVLTALAAGLQLTTTALTHATAAADPAPNVWAQLRNCESGDNYAAVSASGHYFGAYQFDLATWHSIGGTGRPNQASPAEQDYRALYLYRMRGWQPWTCAASLHLRADRDAASHRVPTYAQAASIGGTATTPAWPGKVYNYGDCAPALRVWQLRMNAYGFAFDGTGCYGAKTRTAVLALQRANGIKDSGLLGPQTWKAAWQGKAPKP